MVITADNSSESKASHVKATWGKRCDILYFVSTVENSSLPSIAFNAATESRNILWGKTKTGFRHAFENFFHEADWFLKVG